MLSIVPYFLLLLFFTIASCVGSIVRYSRYERRAW